MGTNYYLHSKNSVECNHCGQTVGAAPLHIGKSSYGWYFSLHVIPEDGINSLKDWIQRWSSEDVVILDEYGEVIKQEDMLSIVTKRSHFENSSLYNESFLRRNSAERGMNNLLKHKFDGKHCVGYGDGTYSYIAGCFS